jgi:hypothetical protein
MILVNSQSTSNKTGSKKWRVERNELPHGGVIVGEDLELSIEIQIQEHETSKSSSRMSRRHRLKRVVDLLLVARADGAVEHDLAVSIRDISARSAELVAVVFLAYDTEEFIGNNRFANRKEVWA